ncbi:MAG: methionyl-tRNA formyltransferase, partial [Thalassotalea sp.]|nr:methionyl-tRNA formyltransferase [Thalassotalea sp.]
LKATCEISQRDTSATIYEKLAVLGPQALLETLTLMAEKNHQCKPQNNDLATYASKLNKEEAELNWQLPAKVLHQKLRAYIPWPVAQFTFTDEKNQQHRIRAWQASIVEGDFQEAAGTIVNVDKTGVTIATSQNALKLENLQLPGKKSLAFSDILNGRADWFQKGQSINGLGE